MGIGQIVRKTPFLRAFAHRVPPYHVGSVLENRLGLQVARCLSRKVSFALRREPEPVRAPRAAETLRERGVVVLRDFLPPEVWQGVRAEYDRLLARTDFDAYRKTGGEEHSMRAVRSSLDDHAAHYPMTLQHLGRHPVLLELASTVLRRDLRGKRARADYLVLQRAADLDDDIENILHADVHYPTAKAFFYLDDVTERNGPFVYAPGTHKASWARLRYEYDMSVRKAKLDRGDRDIPAHLVRQRGVERRNVLAPEQRKAMDVAETPIVAPANTLIVANTMGFHRRGGFEPGQRRGIVLLNFRHFETGWLRRPRP